MWMQMKIEKTLKINCKLMDWFFPWEISLAISSSFSFEKKYSNDFMGRVDTRLVSWEDWLAVQLTIKWNCLY